MQGMLLNAPELVPFRMTRNVVDGCGAAGTGGTLTRCSEVALRVLRHHREAFMQVRWEEGGPLALWRGLEGVRGGAARAAAPPGGLHAGGLPPALWRGLEGERAS